MCAEACDVMLVYNNVYILMSRRSYVHKCVQSIKQDTNIAVGVFALASFFKRDYDIFFYILYRLSFYFEFKIFFKDQIQKNNFAKIFRDNFVKRFIIYMASPTSPSYT